jgi:hypothetical protein
MAEKEEEKKPVEEYNKSMFITTEEIASLLKVPYKGNDASAFLKNFRIRKKGSFKGLNLYLREEVEYGVVLTVQHRNKFNK